SNSTTVAKLMLPKIPFIFKTAAFHTLSLSETSSKWDLKTELTVHLLRNILTGAPEPLSKTQKVSLRDPGVKANMWVSKVTMPKPEEDDIRQALFKSIDELKEGDEVYTQPELVSVEAEWQGFRDQAGKEGSDTSLSESEKYENMMKEVKSKATILYLHGGAYYLMDPASHRPLTVKLAELTGGRVLSVRYRLTPKYPFPSALLDALLAYLYLLYPPAGSLHDPVSASDIVISGDSAGGNLSLALLQLLIQLHRAAPAGKVPTIAFNSRTVEVPLPGGVALASPWTDITRCMPSLHTNAKYDYLPSPNDEDLYKFPDCEIWPADPPRADLFCEGSAMCHPLVSPLAAMNWTNSPPVYFNLGEEMLADEAKVVAQRMAKQGVKVVWDEFEAMPHVFAMMMEGTPTANLCFEQWATFVKCVAESPEKIHSVGHFITAKKLEREEVGLQNLIEMSDDDVLKRMKDAREKRVKGF
ncbi:acetyl-hydrolase, partial [Tothia fuscella]